jgi:2-polyprenyl-3-methyl-5-hydroxy-6-metoxy-1,4-benzoquinol methylase
MTGVPQGDSLAPKKRWSVAGARRFAASIRRRLVKRTWTAPWGEGTPPARLTATQELFCEWNAERLHISLHESRKRYIDSWTSIRGGHAGEEFRWFCDLSYKLFNPLYDDSPQEVMATYEFYGPLHFLRMLSYEEPQWAPDDPILTHLPSRSTIRILDFGCGLAHASRSLATTLSKMGRSVELALADIPTLRKPFLVWMGTRTGVPTTFLDCTDETPVPPLPPCEFCVATNVLEHLERPLEYLNAFDAALQPGGLLWTDVADHNREFMHISPSLGVVRERIDALGYEPVVPFRLYRKPVRSARE